MNGSYVADPHDVYQGRAIPNADYTRRSPQPQGDYSYQGGGAAGGGYGDTHQLYTSPASYAPPSHSQYYNSADPHTRQENYNGYDYNAQGQAERGHHSGPGVGRDSGGAGYAPHAM